MTAPVVIYTDGACKGNPGPGGWGALLQYRARELELFGGESLTTNNRMELTAVIRALESLKRRTVVEVYTDSQYVKNGIEDWIGKWKTNGWKTSDRKPVKNEDLWRELDLLLFPPGLIRIGQIAQHAIPGSAQARELCSDELSADLLAFRRGPRGELDTARVEQQGDEGKQPGNPSRAHGPTLMRTGFARPLRRPLSLLAPL